MKKIFVFAYIMTAVFTSAFAVQQQHETVHHATTAPTLHAAPPLERPAAIIPAEVNATVQRSFSKRFSDASEVKWENRKDYTKVTFEKDNIKMFAYYKENGDLLAVARNLRTASLPLGLSEGLAEKLKGHSLAELFEVSSNGETAYYAVFYTTKSKVILKAQTSGNWHVYKKEKK